MRPSQIEAWVLRVLDALRKGAPTEDFLVELKARWPDPKKAARQIAGHANAAHGERVLWLIGVDEKVGVVGADREELSRWWPQVETQFDGLAPRLTDLNIPVNGLTVVALVVETDRAPFVVNNPAANMDKEVPWREGTRVRSATRADLIRLLQPLEELPEFELLWGHCDGSYVVCCLFATPPRDKSLVIPVHRCAGDISDVAGKQIISLSELYLLDESDFGVDRTEIAIEASKKVGIRGWLASKVSESESEKDLFISLDFKPARFQAAATIRESLSWNPKSRTWEFIRPGWEKLADRFAT